MKNSCNVLLSFCSPKVQEKISLLYEDLEEFGLIPRDINIEKNALDSHKNNLVFVSFCESTKHNLRGLMKNIDIKKCHIVIISNNEENYFDFAIEHNICNIIHIDRLDKNMLLGILRGFVKKDLGLNIYFDKNSSIFDKRYSLFGKVSMHSLIENRFSDFINKMPEKAKNMFKINCHELVTNALAYGCLGINAHTRDVHVYDLGDSVEIPRGKDIIVRLAISKKRYGISVKDFAGSLTTQRILERIRRQIVVAGETIPQGIEDYTGRGLAILSHHGLLTFSIKPGEFTEVSFICRIDASLEKKPIAILATKV